MEKGGPHWSSKEESRARVVQKVRWMVDEASGDEQDCSKTGRCNFYLFFFSF